MFRQVLANCEAFHEPKFCGCAVTAVKALKNELLGYLPTFTLMTLSVCRFEIVGSFECSAHCPRAIRSRSASVWLDKLISRVNAIGEQVDSKTQTLT
jgi:hypothetical protein